MKFAIVRKPGIELINGITSSFKGKPDYKKALEQHKEYVNTLTECGVSVTVLDADESFPDGTFVEDTALLTENCAVITNPGAQSRKGEEKEIESSLKRFYANFEYIKGPGTLEGGDIMRVKDHFYIGLSKRTNKEGADQLIKILEKYNYTGSIVPVNEFLHLKTGITYLENDTMLAAGEFINTSVFKDKTVIAVDKNEQDAANCIYVNGYILIPKGFSKTKKSLENSGYKIKEIDISEFGKLDGGLTCLSLRF